MKVRVGKHLFVWCFVLVVMAAIAVGDVQDVTIVAQSNENSNLTGEQDISVGAEIQTITFKKGATIREALRTLGAKYQRNIVPSPKVEGILGFTKLYDVTFEEAIDAILGPNLKYKQEGKIIKVYTRSEYQQMKTDPERMKRKVFTLYYISAAEAMQLIAPVLSKASIIKGSSPAETVVPTGEAISAGASGGDTMALNDTIVLLDYPENIAEAEKVLKKLDVRPMQVLVEATILSATLTEEIALGIDWSTLNGVAIDTVANIGSGVADGLSAGGFASAVKTSVSSGGFSAGITSDHVAVFIRALETVTDVTVLANPKILAVNKQLGQVYIGNKIGYQSQTTQTDTSTTQQVSFLETGTKLSFRPYIGNDGYIRMDIQPKDSSGILKANLIPDESSTELATNIMVKDGQTVVIGGLFRDVVNTSRYQIPLLGDLPFLGALFRGTTDKTERQEVIVMLTPHIIEEPGQVNGDARAADIERKRYGARQSIQAIGRAKFAEDHYLNAVRYYTDGNSIDALSELDNALDVRPTYIEALRLKDRIIGEISPDEFDRMERIMLGVIEKEEAPLWNRR